MSVAVCCCCVFWFYRLSLFSTRPSFLLWASIKEKNQIKYQNSDDLTRAFIHTRVVLFIFTSFLYCDKKYIFLNNISHNFLRFWLNLHFFIFTQTYGYRGSILFDTTKIRLIIITVYPISCVTEIGSRNLVGVYLSALIKILL